MIETEPTKPKRKKFEVEPGSVEANLNTGDYPPEVVAKFMANQRAYRGDRASMEVWAQRGFMAGHESPDYD